MSSLKCYYSDIPSTVLPIIKEACDIQYGADVVELINVNPVTARLESRKLDNSPDVIYIVVPTEIYSKTGVDSPKLVEYRGRAQLQSYFISQGIPLQDAEEFNSIPVVADTSDYNISAVAKIEQLEAQLDTYRELVATFNTEGTVMEIDSGELDKYRTRVETLEEENVQLTTSLNSKQGEVNHYKEKYNQIVQKNINLVQINKDLESSLDSTSETLRLKSKLTEMESKTFIKMVGYTGADNIVQTPLRIPPANGSYDSSKLHLVFSGAGGSEKTAYRHAEKMIKENPNTKYVLIDLMSESAADYVFGITSPRQGVEWLESGGDLEAHLSDTKHKNLKVVNTNLRYFNDAFLVEVDWNNRLSMIQSAGYEVVIVFNGISNLVNRVLYNSLSTLTTPSIVLEGSVINLRNLLILLNGLIREPNIYLYGLNKKANKLHHTLCRKYNVTRSRLTNKSSLQIGEELLGDV